MAYIKNLNHPRRKNGGYIVILLFIIFVLYLLYQQVQLGGKSIISTSFFATNNTPKSLTPTDPQNSTSLQNAVQSAMAGTQGSYGIYIKNLKTGEQYTLNPHQSYDTGSLYKLWIMATAYQQIQAGTLNADEVLSEDVSTLNAKFDIDQSEAELTDGTITMTVDQALNQMITISHNYAALLLTEKVKLSSVADFLKANNLTESEVGTDGSAPASTAADISLFLEKLYLGQLGNPDSTNKMISLLKAQKLNDKLPKKLPDQVEVAHKTGEIDYFSHDAGIVFSSNGDYIIVVLSQTDLPTAAEDRIADISLAVYNYFNQNGQSN